MLLACGSAGLMAYRGEWRRLETPLGSADLLACGGGRTVVLDNAAHTVWDGRKLIPVDGGVEAMLLWRDMLLVLSGDTDCLTMFSLATGQMQLTMPAGVYPQDMCLLPGGRSLAVCGGADGRVRIVRLPEMWTEGEILLPGSAQRAACMAGTLYVLCAMEENGLCCQLCRISGRTWLAMARWEGLPGAIHGDGSGRLWVAASEALGCFHQGEYRAVPGEFGLIRHMTSQGGVLLASDPVLGTLWRVAGGRAGAVYEGDVQQGVFWTG